MHLNKKRAKIVKKAIDTWEKENLINDETAKSLHNSIHITTFDWKKAAFWSFCFAVICFFIAFISFLETELFIYIVERLSLIFNSELGRLIISSLLAITFYYAGFRLRHKNPERVYRNEALLLIGVISTTWAIGELGYLLSNESGHFSLLILLSTLIYAVIGYIGKSNLVWLFALISFLAWLGCETGYRSGWGSYYLGMNYPLRFVLFGFIMTAASLSLRKKKFFEHFFSVTLSTSLFSLFTSLWLLSIFGNYSENSWYNVKQIELFHWSILFALAGIAALGLGFKLDMRMLRGYGSTFLLINLYTRFFEYFWDALNKSIFFAILGLSLWLFAKKAEKIWLLTENKFGKIFDKEDYS